LVRGYDAVYGLALSYPKPENGGYYAYGGLMRCLLEMLLYASRINQSNNNYIIEDKSKTLPYPCTPNPRPFPPCGGHHTTPRQPACASSSPPSCTYPPTTTTCGVSGQTSCDVAAAADFPFLGSGWGGGARCPLCGCVVDDDDKKVMAATAANGTRWGYMQVRFGAM
jgi:hypothetical protein